MQAAGVGKAGREVGREGKPVPHFHLQTLSFVLGFPASFYSSPLETKQRERSRNAWAEVKMFSIVANRVSVFFQARARRWGKFKNQQ